MIIYCSILNAFQRLQSSVFTSINYQAWYLGSLKDCDNPILLLNIIRYGLPVFHVIVRPNEFLGSLLSASSGPMHLLNSA